MPLMGGTPEERQHRLEQFVGGLVEICDVGDGPTDEQLEVIRVVVVALRGELIDPLAFARVPAEAIDLPQRLAALRFVDSAIGLEFCRHPRDAAMATKTEAYASHLGVSVDLQKVARANLESDLDRLMSDYHRYRGEFQEEAGELAADDADLARQLRDLRHCQPGSLGRGFYDFHREHGFRFAGEKGGGDRFLVPHDFTHVLTDYPPDRHGEIAVNVLACTATGTERYFGSVVSSLALHEGGLFRSRRGNVPTGSALADPDGASMLADAVARGFACTSDPMTLDHLALADEPLEEVRASLNLRPRQDTAWVDS